jgi:hypothetical protein
MNRRYRSPLVALLLLALAVPITAASPPGARSRIPPIFLKAGANMDPDGKTLSPPHLPIRVQRPLAADAGANMDPDGGIHH